MKKNAINQNCLKKRSELEIISYRKKIGRLTEDIFNVYREGYFASFGIY